MSKSTERRRRARAKHLKHEISCYEARLSNFQHGSHIHNILSKEMLVRVKEYNQITGKAATHE